MICRTCGKDSHHIRTFVEGNVMVDYCEDKDCGNLSGDEASIPDIYWPGHAYKSEALGVEFTSRGQKAKYLKDNGLSEAGDVKFKGQNWIEGSREARRKEFDKERPKIREIHKAWRKKYA